MHQYCGVFRHLASFKFIRNAWAFSNFLKYGSIQVFLECMSTVELLEIWLYSGLSRMHQRCGASRGLSLFKIIKSIDKKSGIVPFHRFLVDRDHLCSTFSNPPLLKHNRSTAEILLIKKSFATGKEEIRNQSREIARFANKCEEQGWHRCNRWWSLSCALNFRIWSWYRTSSTSVWWRIPVPTSFNNSSITAMTTPQLAGAQIRKHHDTFFGNFFFSWQDLVMTIFLFFHDKIIEVFLVGPLHATRCMHTCIAPSHVSAWQASLARLCLLWWHRCKREQVSVRMLLPLKPWYAPLVGVTMKCMRDYRYDTLQ